MEVSGYHYYSTLRESVQVKSITSSDLPDTLGFIAREELEHKKALEKILREMESWREEGVLPREHRLYWESLAFRYVRSGGTFQTIGSGKDFLSRLLCLEQDTIIFFLQMKKFLPEKEAGIISGILEEEKEHLKKIASLSCLLNKV